MKNRIYLLIIIAGGILLSSSIPNANLDKRKSKLKVKLDEVTSYLAVRDSMNPEVSKAAVSWHIDHIFLLINGVYKTVEQSEESNYKSEFNMIRAYVFSFNKIPRGRATAPKSVRPKENVDIDAINSHYNQALTAIEKFSDLPENKHFNHPVFGTMNRDQTFKFITIHTEHHLKIIRDILKDK